MKEYNLHWYGMLTIENLENVVDLLKQLLDGKKYTFVACNEFFDFKPEVRTGQMVDHKGATSGNAFSIWWDEKNNPPHYGGFNVGDTYGVWGCSTTATDEVKHDNENPYFVFEGNKVTITHKAPAGHLLYWVAAVEKED